MKNQTFSADALRPTVQPVSFDFDLEDKENPLISQCVTEDGGAVGVLVVNLRALLGGGEGESAVGAFSGTAESPVAEHVEFAWVACNEVPVDFETPEQGEEVGDVVLDSGEGEEQVISDAGEV